MLQRLFIHLILVVLFALTQMGVVTHEISHLSHTTQKTQPDKNTAAEQCGQCIGYAQLAGGIASSSGVMPQSTAQFLLATAYDAQLASVLIFPYSARAPPTSLNT